VRSERSDSSRQRIVREQGRRRGVPIMMIHELVGVVGGGEKGLEIAK
jgi:hypothetical protein